MELKYSHTLLFVDDEASILKALQRLFRREGCEILTAEGGPQALEVLKQAQTPVSLIVSDQRMPGMNGARFLEEAAQICPDAIRFLLTGYSDLDAVVDAVNKGKIHRYVTKPWNDGELLMLAREALVQVELKRENIRLTELTRRQNEELAELNRSLETKVNERTWALKYQNKMLKGLNTNLENSLMEMIRLLLSLVESSNPDLGRYMREVANLARTVAVEAGLNETQQNQVEMAGLVHDIGLLGMPGNILEKDERIMTPAEFEAYSQHPVIAALSLSSVKGLTEIGEIVLNHHESLDGTGFPARRSGNDIPIGARILAIAADYGTVLHLWPKSIKALMASARRYLGQEVLEGLELSAEENLRREIAEKIILEGGGLRYDGALVRHFMKCIGGRRAEQVIKHLPLSRLRTGMRLEEDLRLKDGRLLLTRGTVLGQGALTSLQSIDHQGLIDGEVAVSLEEDAAGKDAQNG
jgi:response regulator RpfG family c-di-GMP phosphodiesterase